MSSEIGTTSSAGSRVTTKKCYFFTNPKELGIGDRVTFVEDGNTAKMIASCRGVVLVNSTVGIMALEAGKPVFCLGKSIYNIPGLTQSYPLTKLDAFWRAPQKPVDRLFRDFKRVLASRALVRGNFYTPKAMRYAARDAVVRFARAERLNADNADG